MKSKNVRQLLNEDANSTIFEYAKCNCLSVIQYGGFKKTTFPRGRIKSPFCKKKS